MLHSIKHRDVAKEIGKTSASISYRKNNNWNDYRLLMIGYYVTHHCDELELMRMLGGHASLPPYEAPPRVKHSRVGRPPKTSEAQPVLLNLAVTPVDTSNEA